MITVKRLQYVKVLFVGGVKEQMKQEWIYTMAFVIGMSQGLKYTGDLKRGVFAAGAALGGILVVNGVYNVVTYWDKIKEV